VAVRSRDRVYSENGIDGIKEAASPSTGTAAQSLRFESRQGVEMERNPSFADGSSIWLAESIL
jgi:hypothetical protein